MLYEVNNGMYLEVEQDYTRENPRTDEMYGPTAADIYAFDKNTHEFDRSFAGLDDILVEFGAEVDYDQYPEDQMPKLLKQNPDTVFVPILQREGNTRTEPTPLYLFY